jgi:hypothetical protein
VANNEPQRSEQGRDDHERNNNTHEHGAVAGRPSHEEAFQLWRILVRHTGHRGAKITEVLDAAEDHGIDRFWASEMLMFWLKRGEISKSWADNRVVPQGRWWRR